MHAASVNPEPGSNSLKNSISNSFSCLTSSLELFFLASSYFFEFLFSKCFDKISHTISVLLISSVVQFSMSNFAALLRSALLLYYINFRKSIVFSKFFRFFWFFVTLSSVHIFDYTKLFNMHKTFYYLFQSDIIIIIYMED